jgi:hypothetical protein
MTTEKIILLGGVKPFTKFTYNYLIRAIAIDTVILEQPVSKYRLLNGRLKRLGCLEVLGQVLFQVSVVPLLGILSRCRLEEIKRHFDLDDAAIPEEKIIRVASLNSPRVMEILQKENPTFVIVAGTRIISEEILNCIPGNFINIHTGIAHRYRGVHGAYWALTEGRPQWAGVTVHQVDSGIDTGQILAQGAITITPEDNFVTYPLLQLGVGLGLLKHILEHQDQEVLGLAIPSEGSKIWYHPTLWFYLWNRMVRGVR